LARDMVVPFGWCCGLGDSSFGRSLAVPKSGDGV
jgi:hypothetical protein